MTTLNGRDLASAKLRDAYKAAEEYSADPEGINTPNMSGKTPENDNNAYLLKKLADAYDLILSGTITIPGIMIFEQFISADQHVPSGFDGFTASRGVAEGVSVTVAPGSLITWGGDLNTGNPSGPITP